MARILGKQLLQMPVFIVLSGCLIVAGCIAFARLQLNAHTPNQVYAGFVFGCLVQFSLFFLAQNLTFV